ncbi:hypothetical protein Tco_0340174 [Tanacetum coccineum]
MIAPQSGVMHHSKRQNHYFLLVMLRLELHKASVLAVGRLTLGFLPRYTSCFSRCSRRCPILNCFNLGGVNLVVVGLIVPAFLKELICKVLGPLVLLLELSRFGIPLGELGVSQVSSLRKNFLEILWDTEDVPRLRSGLVCVSCPQQVAFPLGNVVVPLSTDNFPSQMTHPVASLTLDSARSCVMQSAFLTQRKASSIPTVFSWGGSIRPEGFLSSILLLAVIIVAVAMVVLVVVDAILLVVVVVSGVPSIIKLLFLIIDSLYRIVLCYLIYQPLSYGNGFLQSLRL